MSGSLSGSAHLNAAITKTLSVTPFRTKWFRLAKVALPVTPKIVVAVGAEVTGVEMEWGLGFNVTAAGCISGTWAWSPRRSPGAAQLSFEHDRARSSTDFNGNAGAQTCNLKASVFFDIGLQFDVGPPGILGAFYHLGEAKISTRVAAVYHNQPVSQAPPPPPFAIPRSVTNSACTCVRIFCRAWCWTCVHAKLLLSIALLFTRALSPWFCVAMT